MKCFPVLPPVRSVPSCTVALLAVLFTTPVAHELQAQTSQDSVVAVPDRALVGAYPGEKSPALAGVLEYLFPTAGFAYAGDWTRGFLPLGVSLAGIGILGYTFWYVNESDPEANPLLLAGGLLFLGGRIWGIAGAVDAAKDHNEDLLQRIGLAVGPSGGRLRLGVKVRF